MNCNRFFALTWIFAGKNILNLFFDGIFYQMLFMYNVSRKDYLYIQNMLDAIDKIKQYSSSFISADDFWGASQAFEASLMNFIVIKGVST